MNPRTDAPAPFAPALDAAAGSGESDGRVMRRQRNMAAVRAAVLDVLRDGRQPTLAAIAQRAGVATRSVYRYFGDVETAIDDAVGERREQATAMLANEPPIGADEPLADRLEKLVERRLRLDRLIEPLDSRGGSDEYAAALDDEVCAALAPELASGDDELDSLLRAVFRLRSVRSMREVFGERDDDIVPAMVRLATVLIAGRVAPR